MSAFTSRLPALGRVPRVGLPSGISAIIVKELRGRMRGRRAFIIVTIHILLLSVFAWMFQRLNEESIANLASYGGQTTYASAAVGRGVFFGLLMVQTLIVAVLAPAATAGAISSEREHQTLELLAVTPISSFAIVVGKLLSALAWVFMLILASIPVTAIVFVFGGVAPDDVIRGYAVMFATVIGLGSIGIFFSALTRRTGASTGLTFVATLVLVVGSVFAYFYLTTTAEIGSTGLRKQPSEAILYLNPFVAQADVICGTEEGGFGGSCGFMSGILTPVDQQFIPPDVDPGKPVPAPGFGIGGGGVIVNDGANMIRRGGVFLDDGAVVPVAESFRDRFWPKSVIAFLVLALVLTTASIQFVTPTRRWRPSLPGPVRRLFRRRSAS
ncbi:MAG TPA: ABC transporter permease subunit [Candidatus Limnocylindria bacterium]|nr:ABC transporter permease subunit [Candidatus Limnocylindria bacterium]